MRWKKNMLGNPITRVGWIFIAIGELNGVWRTKNDAVRRWKPLQAKTVGDAKRQALARAAKDLRDAAKKCEAASCMKSPW